MTTPYLDKASKQLAIKLRDPVADAGADGMIYPAEAREVYLNRAYGKLLRILGENGLEVDTIFPNYYVSTQIAGGKAKLNLIEINMSTGNLVGSDTIKGILFKPTRILANVSIGTETKDIPVSKIDSVNYFDAIYSQNPHYNYKQTGSTYYSIIDGKIVFLAPDNVLANTISIFARNEFSEFFHNGPKDLLIPFTYRDLHLNFAAYEGMLDVGEVQKAQLYKNEINDSLSLILQTVALQKKEEEGNSVK